MGLSQDRFAEQLGVTLRAVQYWEAGTRKPGNAVMTLIRKLVKEKQ